MTILFAGGEMSGFIPSDGSVDESPQGFNSAFVRRSIECNGTVGDPDGKFAESATWTEQTGDVYCHMELTVENTTASAPNIIDFLDASGDAVIRFRRSNGNWQIQYLDNLSAWQSVGDNDYPFSSSLTNYDFYMNVTTGAIALYVQGTKRDEATGLSLGHISGIAQLKVYSTLGGAFYSQFLVSTLPTIGGRLATYYPSGAGATSAWTGTYVDIDEAVYSDADFIFSDTAGQVSTFALTGPDMTGYVVQAVAVCARAKRGASGPQNMQLALRASGADAYSSTIALDVGYSANCAIWETNPTTAADWVNTQISSLQAGAKSIT